MRFLRGAALFVGALALQWWWSTHMSLFGLAPQLLLVLCAALASERGAPVAQSYGFFWGLCLDAAEPRLFGAHALGLTLAGYLVGVVRRQMDVAGPAPQLVLAVAVSWLYYLLLASAGLLFEGRAFWVGWKVFWLGPAFNAAVAPAGFLLVRRTFSR